MVLTANAKDRASLNFKSNEKTLKKFNKFFKLKKKVVY